MTPSTNPRNTDRPGAGHASARRVAAAQAARRGRRSPIDNYDRRGPFQWLWILAGTGVEFYAGAQLHGWLRWALWGMASVSLLVSLVFGPAARKFHRRHKLLAREQVYRVRQLAAKDPASAGLGLLHDVSPGLDRHSTAAGWTFALDTVGQVLADAEAEYPSPTFLGMTMDDNGEWSK